MAGRIVQWNEPMCLDPGFTISGVMSATEEDCIRLHRHTHPTVAYSDEEALDEFMMVNWAWFYRGWFGTIKQLLHRRFP